MPQAAARPAAATPREGHPVPLARPTSARRGVAEAASPGRSRRGEAAVCSAGPRREAPGARGARQAGADSRGSAPRTRGAAEGGAQRRSCAAKDRAGEGRGDGDPSPAPPADRRPQGGQPAAGAPTKPRTARRGRHPEREPAAPREKGDGGAPIREDTCRAGCRRRAPAGGVSRAPRPQGVGAETPAQTGSSAESGGCHSEQGAAAQGEEAGEAGEADARPRGTGGADHRACSPRVPGEEGGKGARRAA